MAEAEAGAILTLLALLLPRISGTAHSPYVHGAGSFSGCHIPRQPCTIFKSRWLKSRLAAVDGLGFIICLKRIRKKNITTSNWVYMLNIRVLGTGKRLLALRLFDLPIDQSPS